MKPFVEAAWAPRALTWLWLSEGLTMEARSRFNQAGVANCPSFDRATRALRRVLDYYNFRSKVAT